MTEKCYLCKTELLEHAATGAQQHVENACPLSRMELYPLAWRAVMQAIAAARADALNEAWQIAQDYYDQKRLPVSGCNDAGCIADDILRLIVMASQPAAETGRVERYCPDCEVETHPPSLTGSNKLHGCPQCQKTLFDPQLDDWPGQTHGKPNPDAIADAMDGQG